MLGGDHHKEPLPNKLPPKVETISEFVFSNELRAVHNLFPEKKGIPGPHNLAFEPKYLATSRALSYKQNLVIVKALEEAIAEVAKEEGFKAIIGMNTGSVTQHVAMDNGYERLETIQVPILPTSCYGDFMKKLHNFRSESNIPHLFYKCS